MGVERHRYTAYGLEISSNRKLSGFATSTNSSHADLVLHMGDDEADLSLFEQVFELSYSSATSTIASFTTPDTDKFWSSSFCYRIRYWGGIEFIVNADGTEVWAQWPDDSDFDQVSACFAGPVLGLALRLRGRICLHASVIAIDDQAIGLIAPSGGGKSTTAAALALKGCPILSDDVLSIEATGDQFIAHPGLPGLRLFDDSAEKIIKDNEVLTRMTSHGDKRYLELQQAGCQFASDPLPLAALYTGHTDHKVDEVTFEMATGSHALLTLLSNTYPSYHYRLPAPIRAKELSQLKNIAQQVPLRMIRYRREFEYLPDLCDALMNDAGIQLRSTDRH